MREQLRRFVPAFLLGALLVAGSSHGSDWPRFRGPNGAGASSDKDVPVRWAPNNVLWKTALPGVGHSSPIIVRGRVFLQSATPRERLLICLDAVKGNVLWTKSAPGGKGKIHPKSSLASSTPTSDGERVFTVFWDGGRVSLFAYDLDGKQLWSAPLGAFKSQHGPGFSPIVHAGKVIVNNDQDGSAVLQAFDAKTGKKAWEATRTPHRACYSTPFIRSVGGREELIVASTAGITAYDPTNGTALSAFEWDFGGGMPLRTVGSPVTADGLIFAFAGDGSGERAMIGARLADSLAGKSSLVWSKTGNNRTPYVPTPVLSNGHLYTINDDGSAACYVARTGVEVWRSRLDATANKVSASPVLIDGKVYAADERGSTYVFEASPTGYKLLARNSIGQPVFSTPAVSNHRLYVRGSTHLFCIGKAP